MRSALILGASKGIGREFVNQLLADGWCVYATARKAQDIQKLTLAGAKAITLDVTVPSSIAGLGWHLDGVVLDLVVYVAGVYGPNLSSDQVPSVHEFDHVMHTNVLGAMQSIPLLAPHLSKEGGKFIFISSLMGSIAQTQSSFAWIYRASKAALNMVVKAASSDYSPSIFVAMNPGWVKTDMGGNSAPTSVKDSVFGMLQIISQLKSSDSGSFQSFDARHMDW
jgi:NAD(P)-dependent dehydrogenase (short-subunit alcohol dehydrogenase family)